MNKDTAYYRARSAANAFAILPIVSAIICGVFLACMGFGIIPIALTTSAGLVPNPAFEGLAAFLLVLFAYTVLYLAACSVRMAMFRMEQADEHQRSTQEALTNAMKELTRELRRRPDVSSPVVFSLFGRSSSPARVPSVKLSEDTLD